MTTRPVALPGRRISGQPYSALPVVPVMLMAVLIIAINIFVVGVRLNLAYPISPWEAGIVTDAWRFLKNDAVYDLIDDHATHMYGPLTTVLLAGMLDLTGPALLPGRLITVVSAVVVVALLTGIFARGDRLAPTVSVALLLAANSRTGNHFIETRPDMASALFTILALVVLYCGGKSKVESSRLWLTAVGTLLLVVAAMFKQTAGVFVIVPLLALVATLDRAALRDRWALALLPSAGLAVSFVAVWLLAPGLWHAMIQVPAQYGVSVLRMGRIAVEVLASFPLFALAFGHWLVTDARDDVQVPLVRWLMAALACAIASSILFHAKDGGNVNCLVPAILAIGAFCAWRAPRALAFLRDGNRPVTIRLAMGLFLAGLMFTQNYPQPGSLHWETLQAGHGTDDRILVIDEARSLPGRVVSPDDPTIALIAKRYAGRTIVFEADAVKWDPGRFGNISAEIDSADYVVVMRPGLSADGTRPRLVRVGFGTEEAAMLAKGFARLGTRATSASIYELWRRDGSP